MSDEPSPEEIAAAKGGKKKTPRRGGDLQQKISYLPDIHRLLPQAPDAERGVLGSLLLSPQEVSGLCADKGVDEDWFHLPAHALIFTAHEQLRTAGHPGDFVTLTQHMRDTGTLDQAGGAAYVTELFTFMPTAANAAYYLDILAEKLALRRIIKTCTEFAARSYDEQDNPGQLLDDAQTAILAIARPDEGAAMEHIKHVKEGVTQTIIAIEETYNTRGGVVGLSTGFHQLDRMTGGLRGPQLIVIAGRPSMGKSAFLWNIAEHIALGSGDILPRPVLGFSLEMNLTELAGRMVLGRANINLQRVRDGFLSHDQMSRTLPNAASAVAKAPIWIDETAGLSIQELRPRVRRFLRRYPDTAAVFIDYLQLMRSTSKRAQENRALEIAEISGGLKRLAKEIGRPIITAAQLNRDNDGPKTPPKLSNLRESGSIEQDADMVLLLHRRHYYTKDDEDKGKATADLAKQRNGPTGEIKLCFNSELARFENPSGQDLYSNNSDHRQRGGDE